MPPRLPSRKVGQVTKASEYFPAVHVFPCQLRMKTKKTAKNAVSRVISKSTRARPKGQAVSGHFAPWGGLMMRRSPVSGVSMAMIIIGVAVIVVCGLFSRFFGASSPT